MKYIYYYYDQVISYKNFISNVPQDWEDGVVNDEFSWGGYKAVRCY